MVSEHYKLSVINNLIEIIRNEKALVFYKGIKFKPFFEDLNEQTYSCIWKDCFLNQKLVSDSIELPDKKMVLFLKNLIIMMDFYYLKGI